MLRILTASSILALSAVPAIAQQADPSASPTAADAAQPVDQSTTTETATEPAQPTAPADAAAPADTAAPSDAAATADASAPAADGRAAQVTKVVDAEFPVYDANKTGDLEQPEFNKWVLALHAASTDANAKAMDEAAKTKWASDAFASADTDKNQKISKAEISKFLMG